MKNWERKFVPAAMAIAGIAFLIAAFKPVFRGLSLNVTLMLVGVAWLAIGIGIWLKSDPGPGA